MKNYFILGTLLLIAVVIFLIYSQKTAVYGELTALKLVPKEEPLTELYFDTYPNVSSAEAASGVGITFSFTIHNLEGVDTAYPYFVYISYTDGTRHTIASTTVFVANGQYTTIKEAYALKPLFEKAKIFVTLPQLGEAVDFALPNNE